jgi:hypothetical protein
MDRVSQTKNKLLKGKSKASLKPINKSLKKKSTNSDQEFKEKDHRYRRMSNIEPSNFKLNEKQIGGLKRLSTEIDEKVKTLQNATPFFNMSHREIVRHSRSQIPYGHALFTNGTQNPTISMTSDFAPLTTTAGNILNQVVALQATGCANYAIFANVFDEVRAIHIVVHLCTTFVAGYNTATNGGISCGVVDYVDSTALTTTAAILEFDNKKIVPILTSVPKMFKWEVHLEHLNDSSWVDTATNVTPAYLKFYSTTINGASTQVVGYVWYEMVFQYRSEY